MYSVNQSRSIRQSLILYFICIIPLVGHNSYQSTSKASEADSSANRLAALTFDPTTTPTPAWLPKPTESSEANANDASAMKSYSEIIPGSEVKFDMVPIPAGSFMMGSPESEANRNDDEGPQHEVKIQPFWMGKCEVTWQEYELWGLGLDLERRKAKSSQPTEYDKLGDAIARPTKPYSDMSFGMGKSGYPALCMTQFAAKMYCKWLSAKTGHYYRLPTEAEWEYACRAGTSTAYSCSDDPEKLDAYAWHEGNSDDKYHKVGQKKPNAWGLYDMHGNVAEWCLDQYAVNGYKEGDGKIIENPLIPTTKLYPHVVRGGSWIDGVESLRSAARLKSNKDWKIQDPQYPQSIWYFTDAEFLGFRIVRPLKVPNAEEAAKYELSEVEKKALKDYLKAQAGKQ